MIPTNIWIKAIKTKIFKKNTFPTNVRYYNSSNKLSKHLPFNAKPYLGYNRNLILINKYEL